MKNRFGFVSNSSSSSFITYASKEACDAALAECTELQKNIVKLSLGNERQFLNRTVMSYSYPSGNNADWWDDELDTIYCDFFDEDYSDEKIIESGFALPDEDQREDVAEYIREKVRDFACGGGFETLLTKKAAEHGENTMSNSFDF